MDFRAPQISQSPFTFLGYHPHSKDHDDQPGDNSDGMFGLWQMVSVSPPPPSSHTLPITTNVTANTTTIIINIIVLMIIVKV